MLEEIARLENKKNKEKSYKARQTSRLIYAISNQSSKEVVL